MDKYEALDWFLRRKSMCLDDKCQAAEDIAIECIMRAIDGDWISVKDRLPDEDVDVLVSNGLGIEVAAYTTNPTRRWYGMFGNTVYAQYWMPLPEPPKEG